MTVSEIHAHLVKQFGADAIPGLNTEAIDHWIEVAAERMAEVAEFLKQDEALQFDNLTNLSAVDYLATDPRKQKTFGHEPHLEVVYHLYSFPLKHRCTIKVKLPRWKNDEKGVLPEVPSVAHVWAIADWHARDAFDLMGVRFLNHPNLSRILCPDDWVGHALRKDYEFPLEYHGIRGM
ncbi:MAG: NADH-quinone oxidoreductase subunit C [Maioricimonas sp. JB049]